MPPRHVPMMLIALTESGEVSTLLNTIETHANMDRRLTINSSKSVVPQYPAGDKSPSVDLQINGCVLDRRPHISGFSREQLAPSTHNESAPEQCMRCLVQDCMAEMVSTPWCRPRYEPLTSVHGCYTMQSSGASTTQTQTFWRSFSGID